jgi:hypothetical protein
MVTTEDFLEKVKEAAEGNNSLEGFFYGLCVIAGHYDGAVHILSDRNNIIRFDSEGDVYVGENGGAVKFRPYLSGYENSKAQDTFDRLLEALWSKMNGDKIRTNVQVKLLK